MPKKASEKMKSATAEGEALADQQCGFHAKCVYQRFMLTTCQVWLDFKLEPLIGPLITSWTAGVNNGGRKF